MRDVGAGFDTHVDRNLYHPGTTNEEKYSAEPVKMSKLEENDQNLYGIT